MCSFAIKSSLGAQRKFPSEPPRFLSAAVRVSRGMAAWTRSAAEPAPDIHRTSLFQLKNISVTRFLSSKYPLLSLHRYQNRRSFKGCILAPFFRG